MTAIEPPRRQPRRRIRIAIAAAAAVVAAPLIALAAFVVIVPPPAGDFRPESWRPGEARTFPEAARSGAEVRLLGSEALHGPEDVVADAAGRLYTGDRDGIVWRYPAGGGMPERWAQVGGRPLGLAFAPDGRLLIANHGLGLQSVDPDGTVRTLTGEVDGRPILFANDLDVSTDGIVYLSDSSSRYNTTTLGTESASYLLPDTMDGRASGRVISYDLATGNGAVLADDLYFPNGIALTADESSLWLAESNRYAVRALDLASGEISTVLADLPGTPDNIDRAADGRMLIAIYDRNALLDNLILPTPIGRQILIRLPTSLFVNEENPLGGSIIVVEPDATVRHILTGLTPAATSVHPVGDRWYLGALLGQPVRWVPAP